MAEHPVNPSGGAAVKKMKEKNKNVFEFCNVCKRNHDQGLSHRYFPSHKKLLSSFLDRFRSKLADVRFFVTNPGVLRPEHASRNRLWCVFCDSDVEELGSSFACENAIHHLASTDHMKNLKEFLWKYGGGMERLDTFRISEKDLSKWEKKCESLKREAGNIECHGPTSVALNDIHNELESQYLDSFHKNNLRSVYYTISNGVMPLQNHTNERHQILHTERSTVSEVGGNLHHLSQNLGGCAQSSTYRCTTNDIACGTHLCNGGVRHDEGTFVPSNHPFLQSLTQISSSAHHEAKGNVHSGAPPPWLVANEGSQKDVALGSVVSQGDSAPFNKRKKSTLNPKRVGAAWAERRKIEIEMEKRGEHITSNYDDSWLPNFGRVWQSGSRKESINEFQAENKGRPKVESQPEEPIQLQPYISKRMRNDASG